MAPDDATDISDYLLGEITGEDRVRIERRMRVDPAFRDEVERLIPVRDQLRRLPASAWGPPAPCPEASPRRDGRSVFLRTLARCHDSRAGTAALAGAFVLLLRIAARARGRAGGRRRAGSRRHAGGRRRAGGHRRA